MEKAVVLGASGAIGGALVRALVERGAQVWAGSRSGAVPEGCVGGFAFELGDEASLAAGAAQVGGDCDLVVVATGMLQDSALGVAPEKSFKAMDPVVMAQVLAANTIGPAMAAKHFLPLLPRGRRGVLA